MLSFGLTRFAQTDSTELNPPADDFTGQPITADPVAVENANKAAAGLGIVMLLLLVFSAINLVFFIIALIHLIKNADVPNRTMWIVLCILVPFASWVYVFGPRRSYNKHGGGSPAAQPYGQPSQAVQNSGQAQSFGNPTAPQQPASTGGFTSSQPPVAPTPEAVTTSPAPQVAAAPENPVQVPPSPISSTNSFEPAQPPQDQPSAPEVFEPQPTPQPDVVANPYSQNSDPNQNPPENQNKV